MQKIIALFVISSLMACQGAQKKNTTDATAVVTEHTPTSDSLTYSYDSVKVYSKTPLSTNKQVTDTAKATFTFPVFKDVKLNALVQENALVSDNPDARAYASYQDYATSFIKEFDDFKKDNADTHQTWFKEVDIQVLPQHKNYLGLKYSFVEYVGGAHQNSGITYKNYTVNPLQLITLSDLIQDGKRKELTAIAEQIFRKNEKISATKSLSEDYFFDKGVFVLNDNFTITNEGLKFLYNSYEIKAYAYGRTELLIPYTAIKHILKPNTIVPVQ